MSYDVEEFEDLNLIEIRVGENKVSHAGISASGDVYLQGDIHPLGSATALLTAAKHHIPYVSVSAVEVLYPADWLKAECLHDLDRLRVITNLEKVARSSDHGNNKT